MLKEYFLDLIWRYMLHDCKYHGKTFSIARVEDAMSCSQAYFTVCLRQMGPFIFYCFIDTDTVCVCVCACVRVRVGPGQNEFSLPVCNICFQAS